MKLVLSRKNRVLVPWRLRSFLVTAQVMRPSRLLALSAVHL
jgi:hypothetical protein